MKVTLVYLAVVVVTLGSLAAAGWLVAWARKTMRAENLAGSTTRIDSRNADGAAPAGGKSIALPRGAHPITVVLPFPSLRVIPDQCSRCWDFSSEVGPLAPASDGMRHLCASCEEADRVPLTLVHEDLSAFEIAASVRSMGGRAS